MPIGVLNARLREPKKKKEKPQKFTPIEMKQPPQPPVQPQPPIAQPEIGAYYGGKGDPMRIALVCRTHQQAVEYLCGLRANMTGLQSCGVSMATTQNSAVSRLTTAKSKLDRAFFNRVAQWTFDGTASTVENFIFQISGPSQDQSRIQLELYCGTPQALSAGAIQSADAVWVLLDGHLLALAPDSYESAVQSCLRGVQKPVYLLLSQMEGVGMYWNGQGRYTYPTAALNQLTEACRSLFASCLAVPAAVIPVQIYGGMEYAGVDAQGVPVLKLNTSSGYAPVACEAPALHTVAKICGSRGINYFESTISGGYLSAHRKHLTSIYNEKVSQPPMIGGNAEK
ncbi:MAG: hypothetical protein E7437_07395 [Ruminococcaceae bacterium]|nr:hypothetical protein [Oscillospiraceae bacterium]